MDNWGRACTRVRHTGPVTPETTRPRYWSTPLALIVAGFGLTAAATIWWLLTTTATDSVFVGLLALVLAAASVYGVYTRPRLEADDDGIAVRGFSGRQRWRWSDVDVRIHRSERLGRTVELLEIDVPEHDRPGGLLVLGRFELGAEPLDVAAELRRIREGAG